MYSSKHPLLLLYIVVTISVEVHVCVDLLGSMRAEEIGTLFTAAAVVETTLTRARLRAAHNRQIVFSNVFSIFMIPCAD